MLPERLKGLSPGARCWISGGCAKHIGKGVILQRIDPDGLIASVQYERAEYNGDPDMRRIYLASELEPTDG